MSDSNFIEKLAAMAGMDKEDVLNRLEDLNVDDAMSALDAAASGDKQSALKILKPSGTTDESDEKKGQHDINADQDGGEDFENTINPLLRSDHQEENDIEEAVGVDGEPNVGDNVIVKGKRGVVKLPRGPRDTVGVMLNGVLTMVKKDDIKLSEGVMGMTRMPDLSRMRELAGLPNMEPAPMVSSAMGSSLDVAPIALPPPSPACEPDEATVSIEVEPVEPTSDSRFQELAGQEAGVMDLSGVMSSFDMIEKSLPELKVKDATEVRQRLNQLMSKLTESRARKF